MFVAAMNIVVDNLVNATTVHCIALQQCERAMLDEQLAAACV